MHDPRTSPLDDAEQAGLVDAVRATSVDAALDLLLVRSRLETGARRHHRLDYGASPSGILNR